MLVIELIILIALIRLQLEMETTQSAVVIAGIYTTCPGLLALLMGAALLPVLLVMAIVFGISWGYFWLIKKYQSAGLLWWAIVVAGAVPILLGPRLI
ncbi:MAG: hypothetical protein ACFBZ8_09115 [Opitutales bacterium]